jgi:hypothetical protein
MGHKTPQKMSFFSHKRNSSWHVWGKFCGFIHYIVQYVVFIVA